MQAWLPGYAGFLTQDLRRCVENRGQVPGQVFERKASLRLGQERKKKYFRIFKFLARSEGFPRRIAWLMSSVNCN